MLKYAQEILSKVSFDKHLFRRELKKFIQRIDHKQKVELKAWVNDRFHDHSDVIRETFDEEQRAA